MSEIEECEAVMAEYAAAVMAKEPSRLLALYAPDVRVFDAFEIWSFEDGEAWGRNLHAWLGSLGDEDVRVQFDAARLAQHADTGLVSAIVTYSALDAAGHVVRSMQNRISWLLVNSAGHWLIAHEHTSAPISFDGMKAILRRD